MNVAYVRTALDAALREAGAEVAIGDGEDGHAWGGTSECRAHNEGLNCCLDPEHENYDRMLDDLAARIARRLP